ncbi:MAG TPA: calcium-translocating P-type ATPase, PMCA-type [Longimicrobium sp.]|nr:calcium-translocating P-type ATPase, PMCA-type [Longimicrobium sp.]
MEMLSTRRVPNTTVFGLTSAEVAESRARHGANVLTPPERDPWWKLYLEKFDDPVIRILIIAGLLSFGVGFTHGEYYEGIGIVIAVLLATGLAFINEYRANAEFDLLNQTSDDVPVKVLRDGAYTTVLRRDVVVGDVVLLSQGDEVPADGRLVESVALQVNESSLTGELVAAKDHTREDAGEGTYPANRVYRGTTVADGSGILVVQSVGDATEIGRTARAAAEDTDEKSPLNQQLERLSKWIGVAGFAIAVGTFLALIARAALTAELVLTPAQWTAAGALLVGTAITLVPVWLPILYDFLELTGRDREPPAWLDAGWKTWSTLAAAGLLFFSATVATLVFTRVIEPAMASWLPFEALQSLLLFFMIAVTIVVVAVPEGLAMSVTLSLAYSMRRMTASNCLVRRLDATETIGAATHICSDKTGTLTMNQMRVQEVHLGVDGDRVPPLVEAALAVNGTANLGADQGEGPRVIGNPTEGALLLWLARQGQDYGRARTGFDRIRQWPFSTERKYMATLGIASGEAVPVLHVKGAPDVVLALCTQQRTAKGILPLSAREREEIAAELRRASSRAMRTLAFAYRAISPSEPHADLETVARELVWIGWVGIADPVRPEVREAVARARRAGIDVKIVTGDNADTAREVGRQIGLWTDEDERTPGRVLTGPEFSMLGDAESEVRASSLKILARARPADKLRLVDTLKKQGVVAVTGDGVNDGPALNHADVGLSMGRSGAAVAREASDIVILDDSFGSITTAVKWGRSLYLNIQKFILFQLTINVVACGIALLGPFIGVALPLKVTQMLWVNLIMDTFAALALATEPPEENVMNRPPRKPSDFIVSPEMARRIFGVGLLFLVLCVALLRTPVFGYEVGTPGHLTVFFTFFVLLQFWNAFNARTLGSSRSAFQGLGQNPWFLLILAAILVGQVLIVQLGGGVFHVTPLPLEVWAVLVAGTSAVLWTGEVGRFLARRAGRS